MLRLVCDRCGSEFDEPGLCAPDRGPYANSVGPGAADVMMPEGWRTFGKLQICDECAVKLDEFMKSGTK